MNERMISFHAAVPAQSCAFNPVIAERILSSAFEVKDLFGAEALYLVNAVPCASYLHNGTGWSRVSVPVRLESDLLQYLKGNHSIYKKL